MKPVKLLFLLSIVTVPLLIHSGAYAEGAEVVPEQEEQIAESLGVSGPTETRGIASSEVLGAIDLGEDFDALRGRSMRARRVTISPGGVVGVHQHNSRPGVLYMLEGELTEFRNTESGPLLRRQGDASFEKGGVIHWWRNESQRIAVALVVDIVPGESVGNIVAGQQ